MSETSTLIGYGGRTVCRQELALVPTPPATETHRPIPHHEIVGEQPCADAFPSTETVLSAASCASTRAVPCENGKRPLLEGDQVVRPNSLSPLRRAFERLLEDR
jgi:hypothetical protein